MFQKSFSKIIDLLVDKIVFSVKINYQNRPIKMKAFYENCYYRKSFENQQ